MTEEPPSVPAPVIDPAAVAQLHRNRMAALLDKYNRGRALSKSDRADLRAFLGGALPGEVVEPPPSQVQETSTVEEKEEGPRDTIPERMRVLGVRGAAPVEDLEIFRHARESERMSRLFASREFQLVTEIAASCMAERPTEPVWSWAEKNVWLDDRATSEPGFYDLSKTPWAREWQQLPLRPEVRQCRIKKSSRVGGSEAAFNIIRWMPGHWPGNVGLSFPDDAQARSVVDRRLLKSIQRIATAQRTGDSDDEGLSSINLTNMSIRAGGSGSSKLFTEWWVRFFVLDELDEHDQTDTTSTLNRALSRQADVADALCFAISKPKKSGGPIDAAFVEGSQKKYLVPCPREGCGKPFEFQRNGFRYQHAQREDGTWDLNEVIKSTWYQCPHCQGKIEEHEKRAMCIAGSWVATPEEHRRRNKDGRAVQATPGIESYQISDYYSFHDEVSWGKLMVKYLKAFEIDPDPKEQEHYINNHEGECVEPADIRVSTESIAALKAGRVETREVKNVDGTKTTITETLGIPGGYRLHYVNGRHNARMPFKPDLLLAFVDKQGSFVKYCVFAITVNPSINTYLVDLGQLDDEDAIFNDLLQRKYWTKSDNEPMTVIGGFMDSRYRGQEVYRLCLRAHEQLGKQFWPVRGEGERDSFKKGSDGRRTKDLKGKLFRTMVDRCETGELMVRYFKDHPLKSLLYETKIKKRAGWRIWLPIDYPEQLAAELTAEYYDEVRDEWVHEKAKTGPNDYGDCFKYLCLWITENMPALKEQFGAEVEDSDDVHEVPEDPETAPVSPLERGRTYELDRSKTRRKFGEK